MLNSEQNIAPNEGSGDGLDPSSGIKLSQSSPLSNNPFVHLTIDKAQAQPQPEAQRPVASRTRPVNKNPRMSRSIGKIANDPVKKPMPKATSVGNVQASGTLSSNSEDAKEADPALRVILENKAAQKPTGNESAPAIGIGTDHINVPADLNAEDEIEDIASSFPMIPKSLIFNRPQNLAGGMRVNDPRQMAANSQSRVGAAGMGYSQGMPNPSGQPFGAQRPAGQYVSGNPRSSVHPFSPTGNFDAMGGAQVDSAAYAQAMGPGQMGRAYNEYQDPAIMGFDGPASSSVTSGAITYPLDTFSQGYRPYAAWQQLGRSFGANPLTPANIYDSVDADQFFGGVRGWQRVEDGPFHRADVPSSLYDQEIYASTSPGPGFQAYPHTRGGGIASPAISSNSIPLGQRRASFPDEGGMPGGAMRGAPAVNRFNDGPYAQPANPYRHPNPQIATSRLEGSGIMGGAAGIPQGAQQFKRFPAQGMPGGANPFPVARPGMSSGIGNPSERLQKPTSGTPMIGSSRITNNPLVDDKAIEESSIFDEPPVPIKEGMKDADTSHKRKRHGLIAVAVVLVLALGGTGAYFAISGTAPDMSSIISSLPMMDESGNSGASNQSDTNTSNDSSSAGGAGSVVYQYTAATSDGTTYTVEETATFSDEGYCELTTMKMKFPDAEKAKAFTDSLADEYGSAVTINSIDGDTATVTIDNSMLKLDREEYENSLRYSVEDLVILKK